MSWQVESIAVRGSSDQDRVAVIEVDGGLVFALADGAGGRAGGGEAADRVIARVTERVGSSDPNGWPELLAAIDRELASAGETTAVVGEVLGTTLVGASAGDSEAWRFRRGDRLELTCHQRRLRVGSGAAEPRPIGCDLAAGDVVVLGSDGLFKYANVADIASTVAAGFDGLCRRLVDLVRLPNGGLHDDVAVIAIGAGVSCRELR